MIAAKIINLPTQEELLEKFECDMAKAESDFKLYKGMFARCGNPPPCLECALKQFEFCLEKEYYCPTYIKYMDDPKAEKGLIEEEEEQ